MDNQELERWNGDFFEKAEIPEYDILHVVRIGIY
jgi:hypothetical protein